MVLSKKIQRNLVANKVEKHAANGHFSRPGVAATIACVAAVPEDVRGGGSAVFWGEGRPAM
jgi:hypothetical protein